MGTICCHRKHSEAGKFEKCYEVKEQAMPDLKNTIAYLYLEETKFNRSTIYERPRPNILPGEPFKRYKTAEKVLLKRLWAGKEDGTSDLWLLLQNRRSRRNYTGGPISIEELSLLLWSAQGVTAQAGPYYLRTAPSAGALYPVETYVIAERISGVDPGIYHFDVKGFQLETIARGSFIVDVARGALGQGFIRNASCVFIWSAVLRRTMSKYGARGLRYIFLDAGHICQNLLLAAEALGLGACPVAAFFDDELNEMLEIDGNEETLIYMAAVGRNSKQCL